MAELRVDQRVRLLESIPDLNLRSGDEGILCSQWFSPQPAYEVEFEIAGAFFKTRALLLADQIQPTEALDSENLELAR